MRAIIAASLLVSCLSWTAAQAAPQERVLTTVGKWRIGAVFLNGRYAYCFAERDNAQATFRMATRGGRWQVGMPYYGSDQPWGTFEIRPHGSQEYTQFNNDQDGWAVLELPPKGLRRGRRIILHLQQGNSRRDINRGRQAWPLAGSSKAMKFARACDKSGGKHASLKNQPPKQNNANKGGGRIPSTVWIEQESGWQGTWKRVRKTNKFKATWTHPSGGLVRANLTMKASGKKITIVRRDTFGPGVGMGCRYNGVIQGRFVSGHYKCDWGGQSIPWSAQIQ